MSSGMGASGADGGSGASGDPRQTRSAPHGVTSSSSPERGAGFFLAGACRRACAPLLEPLARGPHAGRPLQRSLMRWRSRSAPFRVSGGWRFSSTTRRAGLRKGAGEDPPPGARVRRRRATARFASAPARDPTKSLSGPETTRRPRSAVNSRWQNPRGVRPAIHPGQTAGDETHAAQFSRWGLLPHAPCQPGASPASALTWVSPQAVKTSGPIARCVFPTPGGPGKTTFTFRWTNSSRGVNMAPRRGADRGPRTRLRRPKAGPHPGCRPCAGGHHRGQSPKTETQKATSNPRALRSLAIPAVANSDYHDLRRRNERKNHEALPGIPGYAGRYAERNAPGNQNAPAKETPDQGSWILGAGAEKRRNSRSRGAG